MSFKSSDNVKVFAEVSIKPEIFSFYASLIPSLYVTYLLFLCLPVLSIRSNFAPTRTMFLGGSYSSSDCSDICSPDFMKVRLDFLMSCSSVLETFFGRLATESSPSSSI